MSMATMVLTLCVLVLVLALELQVSDMRKNLDLLLKRSSGRQCSRTTESPSSIVKELTQNRQ